MKQLGKPEVLNITGAPASLGRAVARRFARDGTYIGLPARGRDGLEGSRQDVLELRGKEMEKVG